MLINLSNLLNKHYKLLSINFSSSSFASHSWWIPTIFFSFIYFLWKHIFNQLHMWETCEDFSSSYAQLVHPDSLFFIFRSLPINSYLLFKVCSHKMTAVWFVVVCQLNEYIVARIRSEIRKLSFLIPLICQNKNPVWEFSIFSSTKMNALNDVLMECMSKQEPDMHHNLGGSANSLWMSSN